MPEVHFGILVVEDCILNDLPHIKRDVMNDSIVQQGAFCYQFAYVGSKSELGSDEVVPHFWNVGQMLDLEVYYMPFTIDFPFPLAIGEKSKHFEVVGVFLNSIICFNIHRFQLLKLIDRSRT